MFNLLKDDGKEIILQATETSLYADRIGKMFRFKRQKTFKVKKGDLFAMYDAENDSWFIFEPADGYIGMKEKLPCTVYGFSTKEDITIEGIKRYKKQRGGMKKVPKEWLKDKSLKVENPG